MVTTVTGGGKHGVRVGHAGPHLPAGSRRASQSLLKFKPVDSKQQSGPGRERRTHADAVPTGSIWGSAAGTTRPCPARPPPMARSTAVNAAPNRAGAGAGGAGQQSHQQERALFPSCGGNGLPVQRAFHERVDVQYRGVERGWCHDRHHIGIADRLGNRVPDNDAELRGARAPRWWRPGNTSKWRQRTTLPPARATGKSNSGDPQWSVQPFCLGQGRHQTITDAGTPTHNVCTTPGRPLTIFDQPYLDKGRERRLRRSAQTSLPGTSRLSTRALQRAVPLVLTGTSPVMAVGNMGRATTRQSVSSPSRKHPTALRAVRSDVVRGRYQLLRRCRDVIREILCQPDAALRHQRQGGGSA